MVSERPYNATSGWVPLVLCLAALVAAVLVFIFAISVDEPGQLLISAVLVTAGTIGLFGRRR
jgi:hypothetical protein